MGERKELTGVAAYEAPSCGCGWKRPIIGLTTIGGAQPADDVVPVYACPCCGLLWIAKALPEETAARMMARFCEELTRAVSDG